MSFLECTARDRLGLPLPVSALSSLWNPVQQCAHGGFQNHLGIQVLRKGFYKDRIPRQLEKTEKENMNH